ncbi:MAG: SGNH/GDSL hydrolase family protein, partial [Candidatus Ventricola sp.]
LVVVGRVVERKQSRQRFGPFLEEPQSYDVLLLGHSHMVSGVYPMELWADYGIASYNFASYGNSLVVSYWMLMYALDYMTPKLVVLDAKDAEKLERITGSSGDLHNALDGLPYTRTKGRAIRDLMSDPKEVDYEGRRYVDMRWEYFMPFGKYHGRWSELDKSDFQYHPDRQKGAEILVGHTKPYENEFIDENDMCQDGSVSLQYLRRIIEECQSRGISLLITNLPYPAMRECQAGANRVREIAKEYGVDYIDFVYQDQTVDYQTDMFDAFSHLNASGARKVTDYLGRYIVDHFDVPDRRGDAAYQSWFADYDTYTNDKLELIRSQTDLELALMLLHDTHFSLMMSVAPNSPLYEDDALMTLAHNIAREHVFEEDGYGKFSNTMFPLEGLDWAQPDAERYFLLLDRKQDDLLLECVGSEEELDHEETSFGTASYRVQGEQATVTLERGGQTALYSFGPIPDGAFGVQLLVVDNRTDEVAVSLSF